MLIQILKILISSLIITIVVEVLLAWLIKVRDKKDILNIVLVNIVTNPIVVLFPYVIGLYHGNTYRYIVLALLEVLTVIFEGYIYKRSLHYSRINPYLLSLILNIASYLLGIIIYTIIY